MDGPPRQLVFVRFWLSEHASLLGLFAAALVLAAVASFAVLPLGRYERFVGTVEGFGLQETDTGSYPIASVRLVDRQVMVPLQRAQACRVGAPIHLRLQRRFWGTSVSADLVPCGSTPPK